MSLTRFRCANSLGQQARTFTFHRSPNLRSQNSKPRGRAGIEPATSPTRTENHTSRPTARVPVKVASSEDRTRDLSLTRRMLCQLSYRGDRRVGARVGKAAPGPRAKKDLQKEHARRDSNPQPPDSKSGALSIAPRALARQGAGGPKRCCAAKTNGRGKKMFRRQLRDSNSRGQCPIDF